MKDFLKKIVKWLATTGLLAFPSQIAKKVIFYAISSKNGEVIYFNDPERLKVRGLIDKIRDERELLISNIEAYQIFIVAKKTVKVSGDMAEVGVYKGGSAKLICEAKGNKALHLFDTFEGLPDLSGADDSKKFQKGQFRALFESVKDYLQKYPDVYFYKGYFPSTAEPVKNKTFAFVNIDVDIYESTLSCLEFFYPRMNRGGVILSHDYVNAAGVRKAFDDFFESKPEPIIELSGSQCLIVKC